MSYGNFFINCRLKKETPKEVKDILVYMHDYCAGDRDDGVPPLPDHPFFKLKYWKSGMSDSSQMFRIRNSDWSLRLTVYAENLHLKTGVQSFLSWISPWIDMVSEHPIEGKYPLVERKHIGHMNFYGQRDPVLIYSTDTGIQWKKGRQTKETTRAWIRRYIKELQTCLVAEREHLKLRSKYLTTRLKNSAKRLETY